MGYRTDFRLDVCKYAKDKLEELDLDEQVEVISKLRSENENALHAFNEEGCFENEMSWYDYDKEMAEFSKKYPDYIFVLWGDGQNSDDKWVHYFHNGLSQFERAKIEYGDYDPGKLDV